MKSRCMILLSISWEETLEEMRLLSDSDGADVTCCGRQLQNKMALHHDLLTQSGSRKHFNE